MAIVSDEDIMEQVCKGDVSQLTELFNRYNMRLFNFFLRTTADRELSQDLTQNVFLRVVKYKHTYKIGASFKSWFYQIARNVKIDYFKKKKLQTTPLEPQEAERNLNLSVEDHSLEQQERVAMLHQALKKLPDDKREILVLSQLEELGYKEIAEIFKITENSARVKVHRALKALKDIFHKN